MTPQMCQQALEGVGAGVAASLQAVDCAANAMTQTAYGRLFGTDGVLLPSLTILLTLYVAFFAFSLITGRSRLGISALTPRMITLGLVLTFATSWIAYQSVVWNLAVGAPNQVAGILMGTSGSATQIFADKIDIVIGKLVEAGGNGTAPTSTYSPLGLMWLGGTLLLLGTVGILATAKIALAILLGLGPVFVVMALFKPTRGLFVGWLKGLVLLAVTPMFAVLGGSLVLELAIPVVSSLAPTLPGQVDPQASMAFFLLAAVHVALMVMALRIASTMVAGWTVFGLANSPASKDETSHLGRAVDGATRSTSVLATRNPTPAMSPATSREITFASTKPAAANDVDSVRSVARFRPISPDHHQNESANASLSRTRGIGSRFRAPANARLARSMEKF